MPEHDIIASSFKGHSQLSLFTPDSIYFNLFCAMLNVSLTDDMIYLLQYLHSFYFNVLPIFLQLAVSSVYQVLICGDAGLKERLFFQRNRNQIWLVKNI